jgi:hypothetical protein
MIKNYLNKMFHVKQTKKIVETDVECPKCKGFGTLPVPEYNEDNHQYEPVGEQKCDFCNGKKTVIKTDIKFDTDEI